MHAYTKQEMKQALVAKLHNAVGCTVEEASDAQMLRAAALALRDVMAERGVATRTETKKKEKRKVHYLSMEFLLGRSLMKNAKISASVKSRWKILLPNTKRKFRNWKRAVKRF